MCTLTILPESKDVLRFSAMMNRDELNERQKALPPLLRDGILAPRDADAGGTWTAINESGLIGFVLNRTEEGDRLNSGSVSRGSILPALLVAPSVKDASGLWHRIPLHDMRPFYCLLRDRQEQRLFSFNGEALTHRLMDIASPLLLATSGLGDSLVHPYRESLFARLLSHHPDRETQRQFHHHHDPRHPAQSVMMMRDDARTVSITSYNVQISTASIDYFDIDGSTVRAQLRLRNAKESLYAS